MNVEVLPRIGEIWRYDWETATEYSEYGVEDSQYKHYVVLRHVQEDDYLVYNIECGIEELMSWEDTFMPQWKKVANAPRKYS